MNRDQVDGMLAYFTSAYPSWTMAEGTPEVWADQLASVDVERARQAAKNLVKSSQFAPTVAAFLAECQHVAYDQQLRQLGPGSTGHSMAESSAAMAAIRAGMAEAAKNIPDHRDHDRFAADRCPACSTRSERMDGDRCRATPQILEAIHEHLDRPSPVPVGEK